MFCEGAAAEAGCLPVPTTNGRRGRMWCACESPTGLKRGDPAADAAWRLHACNPTEPRRELIDAYLEELQACDNDAMAPWLVSLERAARIRADIHDIEGHPWRCGLWDVITLVPFIIDDSIRRLGKGHHHGTAS